MALGQSAGVLFKISADNSDAKRAFNETEAGVKGLGGAMGAMGGPAAVASAAVAAVGAAALATVTAIARLTVATAEFGSKLYDASIQTGLSARSISALKLAADTSGSSLESVSGAVSKLNVLVGNAANGNDKAAATLKQYGITATDTNGAFEQAVKVIGDMTSQTEKAAAMQALFKDRTGALGPVLNAIGSDFEEFTAKAEKLGLVLSEEDLKAADDFGDTLDILGKQAQAAGQQFALEFMPNVTSAMQAISGSMENNQSVAREWGRSLGDSIRGVEVYFQGLNAGIQAAMAGINRAFGTNIQATINWANTVLAVVSPLFAIFQMIGAGNPLDLKGNIGGKFGGGAVMPSIPSGGGGSGGGGGKSGGGSASKDTDFADAEKRQKRILDLYKAGYDRQIAENDNKLAKLEINEQEHLARLNEIKIAQLEAEKKLLEETLKFAKITADKKIEIEHEIDRVTAEIGVKRIENDTAEAKRQAKDLEEFNKLLEKSIADRLKLEEEAEKKRQAASEKRQQRQLDEAKKDLEALRKLREESEGRSFQGIFSGIFGSIGGSQNVFDDMGRQVSVGLGTIGDAFVRLKEIGANAMGALAEGVGSLIQNWVLMGSTGPDAMKKLTASILAGVAAQAAVLAIFELAKGFAALFWNPAEAAAHFKAAALFGSVAVVAGVSGRAVAGDSFNQGASTATGGGGGGQGPQQQNNFTTRFNGFGNSQNEALNQNRLVMAALEESLHRFENKITGMSPGDVVAMAADENPGAFRTGYEGSLSDDYKSTGGLMRNIGMAR